MARRTDRPQVGRGAGLIGSASLPRRTGLGLLSLESVVRGSAYAFADGAGGPSMRGGAVQNLETFLPAGAVGAPWIAVGVIGLVAAVSSRYMWGVALTGFMWILWGAGYGMSALGWIDGAPTDWISANTYVPTGLFIWTTLGLLDGPARRFRDWARDLRSRWASREVGS